MNSHGLLHFDAHFRNILTDGRRLYLADLGLATSPRFELSAAEASFLATNTSHDGCHTVTELVNWLVSALAGNSGPPVGAAERSPRSSGPNQAETVGPAARNEFIRRCAEGDEPADLPPSAAAIIKRYAPVAAVMNEFYWKLHGESRTTPYPADEVQRACATIGFDPVLPPSPTV